MQARVCMYVCTCVCVSVCVCCQRLFLRFLGAQVCVVCKHVYMQLSCCVHIYAGGLTVMQQDTGSTTANCLPLR